MTHATPLLGPTDAFVGRIDEIHPTHREDSADARSNLKRSGIGMRLKATQQPEPAEQQPQPQPQQPQPQQPQPQQPQRRQPPPLTEIETTVMPGGSLQTTFRVESV